MSADGVFCVSRGIFRHPMFDGNEYSRRDAWLWLLGNAAWKQTRIRVDGQMFTIERGQLMHSLRFLATKWKWSKNRVSHFLDELKNETMIELKTGQHGTHITICNYDDYQYGGDMPRDNEGTANGTTEGQARDKEEELKKRKMAQAPLESPSEEAELFRRGKEVLGKNSGGLISKLLKAKKGSVPLARAAIEQAVTKGNAVEYIARIINGPPAAQSDFRNPMAGIL